MRVTPITAEDANAQASTDPWPPGDYDFVVQDASEGISNAGNEQIKLTLQVYNRQGHSRTVFDYLPASAKAQWKVRHFAETVGLTRQYETGELEARDMITRPGRCKLRVKPAEGQYSAQNAVADYLGTHSQIEAPLPAQRATAPSRSPRQAAMASAGIIDDDVPF